MTGREQLREILNKVTFDQLIKEKSCVPAIPTGELGTDPLDVALPDTQDKLQ